jgi:hypothetical protein
VSNTHAYQTEGERLRGLEPGGVRERHPAAAADPTFEQAPVAHPAAATQSPTPTLVGADSTRLPKPSQKGWICRNPSCESESE